jgi:hypothetical protein
MSEAPGLLAPRSSSRLATHARLESDGLLRHDGRRYRTTRRWQAAIARAAYRLILEGEPRSDLRVPVALALIEHFGSDQPDEELARLVEIMLPIEAAELDPRGAH